MLDRSFFADKVGLSALASVAAMVTFNVMVATQHFDLVAKPVLVAAPMVQLA